MIFCECQTNYIITLSLEAISIHMHSSHTFAISHISFKESISKVVTVRFLNHHLKLTF